MFKNRWHWESILLSIGLQVILLNVPYLRFVFGIVSLHLADWALCVLTASSVLWVSEIAKYFRRRNTRFLDLNSNGVGIAMNEGVE